MKFSTSLVKFGSVGDLALELKKALTAIAAGWNVEHLPDGTHTATMTLPDTVARRNDINVFSEPQTFLSNPAIANTGPSLLLQDTDQPANQRLFVLTNNLGLCLLRPTTDVAVAINQGFTLDRTGNAAVAGTVSERGRSVPMGEWTDVPFSAANFGGFGGGVYTVSTAPTINRYTLIGKTLLWNISVNGTYSGTATPYLLLTMPGGYTGRAQSDGVHGILCVEGASTIVSASAANWVAGGSQVIIVKQGGSNFSAGAVGAHISIQFEIQ